MATYPVSILPSSLITDFGIYSGLQCAQLLHGIQAETKKSLSRRLIKMEGIDFSPAPSSFSAWNTDILAGGPAAIL